MSSTPTRLGPQGVTNVSKSQMLNRMGQLSPLQFNTFFEDFNNSVDIIAATPLNWTVTKVGTGTLAVASLDGGHILITNSAADNDAISAQIKNPSFVLTAGKESWFATRFKMNDVTQSDLLVGLTGLDTTPIGGVGTEQQGVADGVFFLKIDGQTDLRLHTRKAGVDGVNKTAIATLVNDTFVQAGWHYDGSEFKIYVNDVQVATLAAPFATGVPALVVGPQLSFQNGEAVAKNLTIDYLFACQER